MQHDKHSNQHQLLETITTAVIILFLKSPSSITDS